MNENLTWNFV